MVFHGVDGRGYRLDIPGSNFNEYRTYHFPIFCVLFNKVNPVRKENVLTPPFLQGIEILFI